MFIRNNISVSQRDLIKLFFKGKKLSKYEIPSIKFYNFIMFSLSRESDQEFINFMRGVKNKMKSKIEKEISSLVDQDFDYNESDSNDE